MLCAACEYLVNGTGDQARNVGFLVEDLWKGRAEAGSGLNGREGVLADVGLPVETKYPPSLVVGHPSLDPADRLVEHPPVQQIYCLQIFVLQEYV